MPCFTDRHGREWDVELDAGLITKVRKTTSIHLGKLLADEKALSNLLYDDADQFLTVLVILCGEQIAAKNIDAEQFQSGFNGSAMRRAREVLAEAIVNFCLPPKTATAASESLQKVMGARDDLTATKIGVETDNLISTWKDSATNSAASAA